MCLTALLGMKIDILKEKQHKIQDKINKFERKCPIQQLQW